MLEEVKNLEFLHLPEFGLQELFQLLRAKTREEKKKKKKSRVPVMALKRTQLVP